MPNIHTPERLPGESFSDYKKRRLASKAHLVKITKPPKLPIPPIGAKIKLADWFSGQHTNPDRIRVPNNKALKKQAKRAKNAGLY